MYRVHAAAVCCAIAPSAFAGVPEYFFIPAADGPQGTDRAISFVYDDLRSTLLISQPNGNVVRYNMQSRSFLPQWTVPGELRAIDISQDGSRVVVADGATTPGSGTSHIGRVHVINPDTGINNPITWTTNFSSGAGVGAEDVVVTSDNKAFVTPRRAGSSGNEFLRSIDLTTGQVTQIDTGTFLESRYGSGLKRNQSGSAFFMWEGGSSNPTGGLYSVSNSGFTAMAQHLVYGHVSPDGTRVAANRTDVGSRPGVLLNSSLTPLVALPGESVLTYTFDPVRPQLYYADRLTGEFVTLSSITGAEIDRFDTNYSFDGCWHMEVSDDGSWAFARTDGGVIAIAIPAPSAFAVFIAGALLLRRRPS